MPPSKRARYDVVTATVATSFLLTVALTRFYRRFIFDLPEGPLWGVADDVYISACFGRTLASGDGFLWYPGAPKVEGISNPLWSAVVGLLHRLPGFAEQQLGAWLIALNACLLAMSAWLFWHCAAHTVTDIRTRRSWAWALPLWSSLLALPYWSAEGFEVALITTLTFASLAVASCDAERARPWTLAVLLTAGMATRMDFVWVALPAVGLFAAQCRRIPSKLLTALIVAGAAVATLLVLRRVYYGDWLPNTYYLKGIHWRRAHRWAMGWQQNQALLATVAILWLPWLLPITRRVLRVALLPITLAWLSFTLCVLYSTHHGGDSWKLYLGYDRHTVVGAVLMVWGFSLLITRVPTWRQLSTVSLWSLLACGAPWFGHSHALAQARAGLIDTPGPTRRLEREWAEYAKLMAEISEPKATIALCAAETVVYLSHRGGVDLLGKVDRHVARLPVMERDNPDVSACWRNVPGHNKGDDDTLFARDAPALSRNKPPPRWKPLYKRVVYKGHKVYVRRGSPLVRWNVIDAATAHTGSR